MNHRYFCGSSMLAVVFALGLAGTASAQTADRPTEVEEVIVTGSFIAGTPEDAAMPVDVLSSKELEAQGSPSVVQLVKTITSSQSSLGESNRYNGGAGTATINLRGFGAARTLTLMNGRRLADSPAAAFQGGGANLNFIPTAAVGRIEVLKDGAAATYGSDAIGGVVNFITRRDLDGLELDGEYAFIDGSNGDYQGNVAWGKQFDNGNVLLTAGYRHRSRLDIHDRDWALRSFDFGGYAGAGGWTGASNPGLFPRGRQPVPRQRLPRTRRHAHQQRHLPQPAQRHPRPRCDGDRGCARQRPKSGDRRFNLPLPVFELQRPSEPRGPLSALRRGEFQPVR
ncbi:TonB-dependent receptor plug domain-containing protein [Phenylobacterium sp. J426]|uniref:TonB-dependent receptor plug domain-containing protein n=1 Tax=Phenylobacterium sp. J426 TaxID=2898439 RepID=UPI0021516888|nr:TonB-dependent receptor plug domain-containing protein [Phenylobacterium sp. J426]MCR5873705.1 TonB-dependent receptor plug domain-containing protein [Phenylobacterium sp. J426]